jgi:multiple sugar transport system permease protein
MKRRPGRSTPVVLSSIALLSLALLCLVPIVWLVLAPSKSDAELRAAAPLSFGSLQGYVDAWTNLVAYGDGIVLRWVGNTILYSAGSILIGGTSSIMAGYALATTRMVGRRVLLLLTLVAMIVPSAALVLPLFLEVNAVGLTNTYWSVVLPASLFPFGTYLAFIHFSGAIPKSIYEAARLDGATEWGIFVSVAMPLSKSLVGLVAFFTFVAGWTNYFLPYVMLSDQSAFTLQLGLQSLISTTGVTNPGTTSTSDIHQPEAVIASLITIVPVAIVFVLCQRFLARGVVGGAVKD